MNTRISKSLHLPLLIAGIAAILFGAVANSPLMASIQTSVESLKNFAAPGELPGEPLTPVIEASAPEVRDTRDNARCAECGVIESTREIDVRSEQTGADARGGTAERNQGEMDKVPAKIYETVVRLQNGSMLVINDVSPASWRPGERVKLIGGIEQPGR
jgi:hypothetical protein